MKKKVIDQRVIASIFLGVILFVAGVLHLVRPSIFLKAMPPYIPYHLECIYITGALEIIFAFGLASESYRNLTSKILIAYFIAILPAHIHVSLNQIEMFGVSSPYLLWGRTLFQVVFICWAYYCGKVMRKDNCSE